MAERLDWETDKEFAELSRKVERAWRITTRPQNYSEFEVEGADDFLEEIRMKIYNSIRISSDSCVFTAGEGLMTGLYHYLGPVFLSRSKSDINLN